MKALLRTTGIVCSLALLCACEGPYGSARSPVSGDPGFSVGRAVNPYAGLSPNARAQAIVDGDRQPPGTTDGNQPDRSTAGVGGSR